MREYQQGSWDVMLYDSLDEIISRCSKGGSKDYLTYGTTWIGRSDIRSWSDLERACREPWKAGLEKCDDLLRDVKFDALQSISPRRRRRMNEDQGEEFDLDRLLQGELQWWESYRKPCNAPKTITLHCELSVSASNAAAACIWRGVACVALCSVLEQAGFRCEVIVNRSSTDNYARKNRRNLFQSVVAKRADDPLNMGSLIALCSCWFFRLACFAAAGDGEGAKPAHQVCGAQGSPERVSLERASLSGNADKRILVNDIWSREQALEFVQNQIEELLASA